MLLLLATGKCPSKIRNLDLDHYSVFPDRITFINPGFTKTCTKNGYRGQIIKIKKFTDSKVCPYRTLLDYIRISEPLRRTRKLVIVTNGPDTVVSSATLNRWTRCVMHNARIDTSYFKPYSMCSAATSKASQTMSSLIEVLKMGNWKNTSTFFKFYLCKVKYFTHNETGNNLENQTPMENVPASPLRIRARFALEKPKRKLRNVVGKVPYVELPPDQQGYDTDKDSYTDRDSNFLGTPASTVPPSPASTVEADNTFNVYHPIADINPVSDKAPTAENIESNVIKLQEGTLRIAKTSLQENGKQLHEGSQESKSSKNGNKMNLGQQPDKDVSSLQMPLLRSPKQTKPKQTPGIMVENFAPVPTLKTLQSGMDLLLPNIFGKTDEKVVFCSEVVKRIEANIRFTCE